MMATTAIDAFLDGLAEAPARCLMLDYDGTLAPFHEDPASARPYPGVCEAIDAIQAAGRTHVVIISGRWSRDLLPLLPLQHMPEIWGSHGWERLGKDGTYQAGQIRPDAIRRLVEMDDWSAAVEALGGRCEFKPAGVALHWRGLPEQSVAAIRALVWERWSQPRIQEALALHDFDGGVELRAPGRDKGFAVTTVLDGLPAGTAAAYLGDDTTDEDAFRAIHGRGLGVLVRREYRDTAAGAWLVPPAGLIDFLHRWHAACAHDS